MNYCQVHEAETPAVISDGGKTEFTSLCYSTDYRLFVGTNSGNYILLCLLFDPVNILSV